MFSYEERLKAVKLLIQYDMSYSTVMRELGYPSRDSLLNWYAEFTHSDDLHPHFIKQPKYSKTEKEKVINYYIEHGKCISRTVKKLGYPSRPTLAKWIGELDPNKKTHCHSSRTIVKYTREQKEQAVISLCSRSKSAKEVAAEHGTTRENLYIWRRQFLKEGCVQKMARNTKKTENVDDYQSFSDEEAGFREKKSNLKLQVLELKEEVHRLKIERDIYEKAAEIIKKDQGINIQQLTNREKAIIINALRDTYLLKELLEIISMAKSSYCYQSIALNKDKYADLRIMVKNVFSDSSK
jgi:transposase-like protein